MEISQLNSQFDFQQILDSIRAGIYVFKDGRFIYVNKTAEKITGYSRDELLNMDSFKLLHSDDRVRISQYTEMALEGKEVPLELEARIVRKDGSVRWVSFRPALFGDRLILGTVFDITEMKEIKKRLEESEQVFRVLAENSISGIFIFQDDRFVYVNPIVEELTGFRKEELLQMNFWDLVHPDMKEIVKERGKRRQRGEKVEPSVYEIPFLTKSGEVRWGIFSFSNTIYKGKPAGFCIVNDITENKELEKKLRESEEMFRNLSEESLQGIFVIQDGEFVYVNRVMETTGYSRDELLGMKVVDLVPEEYGELANHIYSESLQGKKITNVELKYRTKDGRERWILVNSIGITYNGKRAVLCNTLDITGRKKLEIQIRNSEEKFRNLWNSVEDILVILDAEGKIRECNRKVAEISGFKREELIGKKISEFVGEEYIDVVKRRFKTGESFGRIEIPMEVNGKKLWIEARANLIFENGKSLLQIIGRDITERKKMEIRLKESEDKFRSLVERSVAGVYLIQNGVFKYVNPKLAEIWGFKPEEMINKKVFYFVHPEYRKTVEENVIKRLSGESKSINYTLKIITKDGGVKDVEVYDSKAIIGGKPAVIGTLIDITELRKSEEKYKKIFSHSPVLIGIVNEYGIFVECNPVMEKTIGRNPVGKSFFDLFPEEIARSRFGYLKEALRENKNVSFIDEINGYYFYSSFIPLHLPEGRFCMAIAEDITELMNLNRLLRTINDVSNLIVHERNPEQMLERICEKLSKLSEYSCSIILDVGSGGRVIGEEVECEKIKSLSLSYPVEITTDLFINGFGKSFRELTGETKTELPSCLTCDRKCPVKDYSYMIILPLVDSVFYGTMLLFKKEKTFENELEMLKTMARDIAFALRSIDVDEQKRKAYSQINKNIEYFAYLLDAIRNPLMVIAGLAEVDGGRNSKLILEQVERIKEIIRKLDKGWIETEKVRNYLGMNSRKPKWF